MLPLTGGVGGDTALLGDPGPDPAGGAQLGDRRELVGGGGEAEFQLPERRLGGKPGRSHRPQVLEARGEGAAESSASVPPASWSGSASTTIARTPESRPRSAAGRSGHAGGGQVGGVVGGAAAAGAAVGPAGRDAGPRQNSERVGAQGAGQRAGGAPRPAATSKYAWRRLVEPLARVKDDRRQVEIGLCEHVGQGVDRNPAVTKTEPERGDAALEVLHDLLAGHHRVGVS